MNFQRIVIGLFILLIAGLAGSFYMNWKTLTRLKTVQAFGLSIPSEVAAQVTDWRMSRLSRRQIVRRLGAAIGLVLVGGCDRVMLLTQRAKPAMRVGYLAGGSAAAASYYAAFRDLLRDQSWSEGQNIVYEYRDLEGYVERAPALAAELSVLLRMF